MVEAGSKLEFIKTNAPGQDRVKDGGWLWMSSRALNVPKYGISRANLSNVDTTGKT